MVDFEEVLHVAMYRERGQSIVELDVSLYKLHMLMHDNITNRLRSFLMERISLQLLKN